MASICNGEPAITEPNVTRTKPKSPSGWVSYRARRRGLVSQLDSLHRDGSNHFPGPHANDSRRVSPVAEGSDARSSVASCAGGRLNLVGPQPRLAGKSPLLCLREIAWASLGRVALAA